MHFSKNLIVCSSAGPKILAFGSHCSENFQQILDCFIPNFKLKYEDSENIKADRVSTIVFNLHQIKRRAFLLGHSVHVWHHSSSDWWFHKAWLISLKSFENIYFAEDETQDLSPLNLKSSALHFEQSISCIYTRKVVIPLKVSVNQ